MIVNFAFLLLTSGSRHCFQFLADLLRVENLLDMILFWRFFKFGVHSREAV